MALGLGTERSQEALEHCTEVHLLVIGLHSPALSVSPSCSDLTFVSLVTSLPVMLQVVQTSAVGAGTVSAYAWIV